MHKKIAFGGNFAKALLKEVGEGRERREEGWRKFKKIENFRGVGLIGK